MGWALGKVPDAEFIHTSYSGALATGNAWQTRELVQSDAYKEIFPGTELRQDSAAKHEWRTTAGGCVYAVGAGGTITGYGAGKHRPGFGGAIIIDDPHKADEARSDVIRNGVIEWFQNTLESRKNGPDTPIILIMQRLHERDLAGWLLSGGNGETWEHVCLPAISEAGEALWPAKHKIADLRRMQQAAAYTFAGQYQQAPSPGEGNIFKPDNIGVIDALPLDDEIEWFRGWDLAASVPKPGSDPDWTVGGKLGRGKSGRYYIGDITRFRGGPDEVQSGVKGAAGRDGKPCKVSIPQDPGQAGKSQVLSFVRLLEGYTVKTSPESGDKVTRAEPFAAQANVGNVSMLRAPWNDALIAEMRVFPNGAHDDQVDALSRAFSEFVQPSTTGILDFYRNESRKQD
jgi:predicted phage terminase large subunit-like protein